MNLFRRSFLWIYSLFYGIVRAGMFRQWDAQTAHDKTIRLLRWSDHYSAIQIIAKTIHQIAFTPQPVTVGGVNLPAPVILAAGFVKGTGFASEAEALAAVEHGENIISGWRTMPHLVGAVEFGSFTRHPRLGNSGTVIWRDEATQSTQNRFGLRNPGACAAAAFLAKHPPSTPFGINIAVSPGVNDASQERQEVHEACELFLAAGIRPAWMTLNLSCPNTEDDPHGHQTEDDAEQHCRQLLDLLRPHAIPLWVKLSPDLADSQYYALMGVFARVGVNAVVATNTLAQPIPVANSGLTGGVGGGRLHPESLRVVGLLAQIKREDGLAIDVIGCGGVRDAASYRAMRHAGADAVQYYSGMIYAGPLVGASMTVMDE